MDKLKVYVVNGYPESGKDTFVDFCLEEIGPRGIKTSTIDPIVKLAVIAGWDKVKNPKSRKGLSDLKDLLAEWLDFSWNATVKKIDSHLSYLEGYGIEKGVVFVFSREKEDIERYIEKFDAKTILIYNSRIQKNFSNHADKNIMDMSYDITIKNETSLEDLKLAAKAFVEREGLN